jgi:DNA-binding transcriptional MerR regulator
MEHQTAPLDPADAALAAAVSGPVDDLEARFDLATLAAEVGASVTLLESVARAGLLLPHHVDAAGVARYSTADAEAVRAGLTLLDAGLPLAELLALAGPTDMAVRDVAERAVEAFLRFVRDPVIGARLQADLGDADEAKRVAERLVTAYERMLPATERLVAHHLRRRLIIAAMERLAAAQAEGQGTYPNGGS